MIGRDGLSQPPSNKKMGNWFQETVLTAVFFIMVGPVLVVLEETLKSGAWFALKSECWNRSSLPYEKHSPPLVEFRLKEQSAPTHAEMTGAES